MNVENTATVIGFLGWLVVSIGGLGLLLATLALIAYGAGNKKDE